MSFWDFPPSSKLGELDEKIHSRTITGALKDADTEVYVVDATSYILHGKEEALLFRPYTFVYKLGVEFILSLLKLTK